MLSKVGFERLVSCLVGFAHVSKDLMGVVHGDDCVFVGSDVDLDNTLGILQGNPELKNRGRLGSGDEDTKEIDILGKKLRWYDRGLTWQAGFGMKDNFNVLSKNGYKDDPAKGEGLRSRN